MKMSKSTYYDSLFTIFVISIVVANVVGARVVTTGIELFGVELCSSGAALTYAFTFLATDIIGEVFGKKTAMSVVKYGFIGQIFALIMIVVTGWLSPVDSVMDDAFNTLLGQNAFFVLGSLCAYSFSQWWDVFIFHGLRDMYIQKRCPNGYSGQGRWIWNNCSTITSQFFDTVIYVSISFGIGLGWFFDGRYKQFIGLIIGQYILKAVLALLDTPFFYLFTSGFFMNLEENGKGEKE